MEYVDLGRFAVAFLFVLGLIGGMAIVGRRYGKTGKLIKYGEGARLEVMEVQPLDARNRLYIVRCDKTQHLLVASADNVQVVAADIAVPKASKGKVNA